MKRRFFIKISTLGALAAAMPLRSWATANNNKNLLLTTRLDLLQNPQLAFFIQKNNLSNLLQELCQVPITNANTAQLQAQVMDKTQNFAQLQSHYFRNIIGIAYRASQKSTKKIMSQEESIDFALSENFIKNRFFEPFKEINILSESFFVSDNTGNWVVAQYKSHVTHSNNTIFASPHGAAFVLGEIPDTTENIAQIAVQNLQTKASVEQICKKIVQNWGRQYPLALVLIDKNQNIAAFASKEGFKIGIVRQETKILDIKRIIF